MMYEKYNALIPDYKRAMQEIGNMDTDEYRTQYVFNSAGIEGNHFTYEDTQQYLLTQQTIANKSVGEHLEILALSEAFDYVHQHLMRTIHVQDLSVYIVSEIHRHVLRRTSPEYAGIPKKTDNRNSYRKFPSAGQESQILFHQAINNFLDRVKENQHPLLMASLLHYELWDAHPFQDGNKRTGRLLMEFILNQYHLPPFFFKVEDKGFYFQALRETYEQKNTAIFTNYCIGKAVTQLEEIIAIAQQISQKKNEGKNCDQEMKLLASVEGIPSL